VHHLLTLLLLPLVLLTTTTTTTTTTTLVYYLVITNPYLMIGVVERHDTIDEGLGTRVGARGSEGISEEEAEEGEVGVDSSGEGGVEGEEGTGSLEEGGGLGLGLGEEGGRRRRIQGAAMVLLR